MSVNVGSAEIRDYSLTGEQGKLSKARILESGEWYQSPIAREQMKEFMKRKDGPAVRDTLIWFAALIGVGYLCFLTWGTWWAVPSFIVYGVLYGFAGMSRWHEAGHGTMFKTEWMNETVYQIASFMAFFPATAVRWSHFRHHSDTIIVGRDPEIWSTRPPAWKSIFMQFFFLEGGLANLKMLIRNCFGKMNTDVKEYVPASEYRKVFWEARIWILILLGVVAACIYTKSVLPAMLVGIIPSLYGFWPVHLTALTQHVGFNEDVLDHRLNTQTCYTNFIVRFLYNNMNYHIEHHMFPMVPYHALPKIHEAMKSDSPAPTKSLTRALIRSLSAMRKQVKDPLFTVERPLPTTARPYRYGPAPYGTVIKEMAEPWEPSNWKTNMN
jgi:fatty acid desaturase